MLLVFNLFRPSLVYHQYRVPTIFQLVTLEKIFCIVLQKISYIRQY